MTHANLYKAQADRLTTYLGEKYGLKLKRAIALEAIARTHGRRSWNELAGAAPIADSPLSDSSDVASEAPAALRPLLAAPSSVAVLMAYAKDYGHARLRLSSHGATLLNGEEPEHRICAGTHETFKNWMRELGFVDVSAIAPFTCQAFLLPGGYAGTTSLTRLENKHLEALVYLDSTNHQVLDDLGISQVNTWQSAISSSSGLWLVCGPTGAGCTTTLKASAEYLKDSGEQVCWLADNFWPTSDLTWSPERVAASLLENAERTFIVDEMRCPKVVEVALRLLRAGRKVLAGVHAISLRNATLRIGDLEAGRKYQGLLEHIRGGLVQRLATGVRPLTDGKLQKFRTAVSQVVMLPNREGGVVELTEGQFLEPPIVDDALEKACAGVIELKEVVRLFGPVSCWQ